MWNSFKQTKEFEKPWLLRFFDVVKFYPVSHDELMDIRSKFLFGKYPLKIEDGTFNLKDYKAFLESKKSEIDDFNKMRQKAFNDEKNMWKAKGLDSFKVEELNHEVKDEIVLAEDEEAVESIMSGNIWKIEVEIGDKVEAGDILVVLESMKMEVEIEAEVSGIVSKILYKESDNIESGDILIIIKKGEK